MRATHAFGTLAIPIPVSLHQAISPLRIHAYAEAVLARISLDTGSRAPEAVRRVRAARTLLLDPIHQHNLATRLIQVGLQPVTRHLDCPVNAAALAKYIRDAGHAADAPRHDGHGTLRERACKFIQSLNGKATVRIAYWHSLLGAELIASGFVVASREYACPNMADPFRLPRLLRNLAFSKHGSDLDDSAAYPRTLLNVFTAGREQAHLFMLHREQILAEVGLYFLGAQTPLAVRRSAAKQLFNALDNDGSLRAWEHTHKCQNTRPWDGPMPPFDVGTDGAIFRLSAYENSRKDLTREFEHRMPAMITFVNDWLCIHKPEKRHRCALTAKSYFLQEAEGLSRQAKIDWAYRCNGGTVTNLQHDGVIMRLAPHITPALACAELTIACTNTLGYPQPVEEKPLDDQTGDGSDSEDDQDDDDHDDNNNDDDDDDDSA